MFAMLLLWSRGALSCSEPCTHDLEAWRAHKLEQLKYAQTEASGAPREHMEKLDVRACWALYAHDYVTKASTVHNFCVASVAQKHGSWSICSILQGAVLRLACGRATSATFFFDTGHEEARTF